MPRNDDPCNCRSNGCLLTPSTVRTPPAGTFPLVSANVSSRMVVSNYYEHFSSSPRGLAIGVDAECLELSWNNSKPTPCLLVRPTYQATSHHAGAAACVLNARAPLGVTHHTNERARETSTTAPPCPLPMHSTRGTGRAIANEPGFVSRVVVVVVSSVVCLGLLQKRQTVAGTVVGNKQTRHSGLVSMFRPWSALGRSAFARHKTTKRACGRLPPSRAFSWFGSSVEDPRAVV